MTDPLGQSQVLPYLVGLSELGHRITLVSWEKPERSDKHAEIQGICEDAAIDWRPQEYHSRPKLVSTWLDLKRAVPLIDRLDREAHFDLVHLRSYIAADIALRLAKRRRPLLFDIRGFWIDERIERGNWPQDRLIYRLAARKARAVEKALFRRADGVITLSHAALPELERVGLGQIPGQIRKVIPCCADLEHFKPIATSQRSAQRKALNISEDAPVLCYLGSTGGGYHTAEMFDFFERWSSDKPDAKFLFVTLTPEKDVRALEGAGALGDRLIVTSASRAQVPLVAGCADVGINFYRAQRAGIAASPVKLGEMLALGIPMVANAGVGDTDVILAEGGGVTVLDFSAESLDAAVRELDAFRASSKGKTAAIRSIAKKWFDLDDGIAAYDDIYRRLGERR